MASLGSPFHVMGMERSDPEIDEAAAEVFESVGVSHWTSWTTGDAPDENLRVKLGRRPGSLVSE